MILRRRLLLACGAATALGPRPALAANAPAPPPAPPPLGIGVLLPASGGNALIGDECQRGIALALDDSRAAAGSAPRPLALTLSDAASQAAADLGATAMIANHASLLLGTGTSALSYSGSAAAELAQIPYIEINAPADGITARGFKFLLRTCETTTMIATVATGAIAARYRDRKIGLLFNTGATGGAIAAAALAQLRAAGIAPLITIGYPEGVADLHDPAGRLNRAGVEILIHAAGPDDVLLMFQAMQDTGWRPAAIFGCGDGYLIRETAYALGAAFDGTFVAGAPFYPPQAGGIAAAYQNKYGVPPRAAASLTAYVGARLVFDTLEAGKGDAARLLDALRKTDIPAGALVNGFGASFDKSGQNTRTFATLQQWRSGVLAPVA